MKEIEKENEKLKETVENLLKIQYTLADSCNKYSKVLEGIREITKSVEKEYKKMDEENPLMLYHSELLGAWSVAEQIQNKINEVLK